MDRNSRSFKMLLALNKKQKDRIKDHKMFKSKPTADNDPDYMVSDQDSESSGTDEGLKMHPKKINISSDMILGNLNRETSVTENSNIAFLVEDIIVSQDANEGSDSIIIITDILQTILIDVFNKSHQQNFTKKGELRKRKKFDSSLNERKRIKLATTTARYNVKPSCNRRNCKRKCFEKINNKRQVEINQEFWKLNSNERKNFILYSVSQGDTKRKTRPLSTSRRSKTFSYFLKDAGGTQQVVCKIFFLGTLGYEKKNDRVVRDALNRTNSTVTAKASQQGKRGHFKIDRTIITEHIESFRPTVAHYRREHAPERRYLPSDINIQMMYNDFRSKHPNIHFSYYLYRDVVSKMKISFVKLGHEECWVCESFDLHSKLTSHKKDTLDGNCDACNKFAVHQIKYISARKQYKLDSAMKTTTSADDPVVASADLQKVIMLPRMDMFKEVIFTPRIIAFNESFVVTGKKKTFPTAVIWHEAISGRSTQDITSTFYAFLLSVRDKKHVILWLDNCSAQNKNWTLFTFFVYIVNSDEVALESLTIKYFEPGHTFMGADSFHHQVERSLKNKGKVYDFEDFTDAVKNAANNVHIINMQIEDFFNWQNGTSQYKLNKIVPRPYLNEMVQVDFFRGKHFLTYKTGFEATERRELNFLNAKMAKHGVSKPPSKSTPRGITAERRDLILSKLCVQMLPNRKKFWEGIPISKDTPSLDDE